MSQLGKAASPKAPLSGRFGEAAPPKTEGSRLGSFAPSVYYVFRGLLPQKQPKLDSSTASFKGCNFLPISGIIPQRLAAGNKWTELY